MNNMKLRTLVPRRATVVPCLRESLGFVDGRLAVRTELPTRPAVRCLDTSDRDHDSLTGFPTDREISQPREWVGWVEVAEDDGWWLYLAAVPGGAELSAWVPDGAFAGCEAKSGLPVLVRTWLELSVEGWTPRQAVESNEGAS